MDIEYYIYAVSLLAFGCASVGASVWIKKLNNDNCHSKEKIARHRWLGMAFAIAGLLWCIPHSKPLLPTSLHPYLLPTAVLCAILAYNYLDYLFSRGLGGFFILLAYYFLHESFTRHTPAAPLFAVFCYIMGVVGIFFSGKPHLLRDFIRKAANNSHFRTGAVGFCSIFGIFCMILGVLHFTMGR